MTAWINDYTKQCTGAKINYNPTGSGAGRQRASTPARSTSPARTRRSTRPRVRSPPRQKRCGSTALDLPMVVGPIAIAYKLNGVDKLTLTPDLIAKIFTGKITTWNDPAITAKNTGVKLPSSNDHGVLPLGRVGHHAELREVPRRHRPDRLHRRAGQGQRRRRSSPARARPSRRAWPRRSAAPRARSATSSTPSRCSGSLNTAAVDNGGGAVELSKDTASAAAAAATGRRHGRRPDPEARLRDQDAGCVPDHPGHLRDRLHQVQGRRHRDVREELPELHGRRRPGARWRSSGYAPLPTELQAKVKASIAKIS